MIITGGRVVIRPGKEIENGYVLIKNGLIAETGEMSKLPDITGLTQIDAGGCLVLPGFVDAHCHIGMWEDGLGFEGDDGNEDTDPCTPHLRAIDAINPLDRAFSEALEAGVTTVVTGPGSSNPIAGQLCALKTYGRRVDDMLISPCVGIKFALGENPKTSFHAKSQTPVTRMAVAAIIREQLQKAKRYMEDISAAQEDDDLEPPELDTKCEALLPLLSGEVKAHFHVHRADDIFTALRISQEFGLDPVLIHCTEGHLVADLLAQQGCKAVFGPLFSSRTKPELANYTPTAPGLAHQAGVEVAIATDHPEVPVHYLALSAALAVAEGMDKTAALAAITTKAAEICGISHRVGSLEPGKDADLLIFDRDPFALAVKPKMVILEGKVVKD